MAPLFIHPSHPKTPRSTPEGQEPDPKEESSPDHSIHSPHEKKDKKLPHYSFTSDSTNYDLPNFHNSALRKYIVLAHDCVAIRFTKDDSLAHLPPSQKYPQTIPNPSEIPKPHDGFSLFKSFTSSNKGCYWNTSLCSSIRSLEYKGYVHPSTILVSAPPHHMNILRNAWSRRILRDPPGLKPEFLGEVEEIVTQPVQQGQFAPLSDSLCWAIAELTTSGQEAFINSITSKLQSSYPQISQPPRDLIFQTLEKLIRDQKIYQTSHGYYVVTPEISSYINYSRSVTPTRTPCYGRISDYFDTPRSPPWGSTPSILHPDPYPFQKHQTTHSTTHLKRHNSLKIIRNKDHGSYHFQTHPSMGARSLSFRLSKCNSMFESDKESDDDDDDQTDKEVYTSLTQKCEVATQAGLPQKKKRRSLFTRLFKLHCTSEKPTPTQYTPLPTPPHPQPTQRKSNPPRTRSTTSSSSSMSGIYASIKTECSSITRQSRKSTQKVYNKQWQDDKKHDSSDASR